MVPSLTARPSEFHVPERYAHVQLDRRIVAEQLLHRRRDELGPLAEQGELIGVAQESPDSVPDEVRGGFVAGRKQKAQHHPRFLGGQLVAGVLGLDQARDEIVAGLAAALLDDAGEVFRELPGGTIHLLFLFRRKERLQSACQIVGPDLEAFEVALRNADHPRDHDGG